MTKDIKKIIVEQRISRISESEKNLKCPGVLRKCNRKLRNLEANNEN